MTEPDKKVRPFDFIQQADLNHLAFLLEREFPQTIAVVLSYLDPPKASFVLQKIPKEIQSDVFHRIVCKNNVRAEILREIERVLEKKLSIFSDDLLTSSAGGVEYGVEILKLADVDRSMEILKLVDRHDKKHITVSFEDYMTNKLTSSMSFFKRFKFKYKVRSFVKKDRKNTDD